MTTTYRNNSGATVFDEETGLRLAPGDIFEHDDEAYLRSIDVGGNWLQNAETGEMIPSDGPAEDDGAWPEATEEAPTETRPEEAKLTGGPAEPTDATAKK